MVNEIKKVALYIRVSTDRQAKEGDSLEAQENALEKYCKDKNYIIFDKYIDGGESGQKIKRTNLQRMLEDVKDNKIDLILMTKLDRWFRNIGDFYKVAEIIKSHNTDWKTIWEDYDTTTASGEFWLNMSLSMGQLEAKRTSERIRDVFNHKYRIQKTVCTGRAPYGYKISDDKKLIIDENTSSNIVALFEFYSKANNLHKTTDWFSANYEIRSKQAIKKYLTNSCYIGKYKRTSTNEIIEDFCPRIIDDDLWEKVQKLLKINLKNSQSDPTRNRHNNKPYIFSGLLICKECGHTLSGKTNCGSNHYYNCRYHNLNKCSNNKCVSEKWLESYILDSIIPILKSKKLEIKKINNNMKEVKDNTLELKRKLNKLTNLYLEEMVDLDYYREEYNLIKSQIESIDKKKKNTKPLDYSYIDEILKSDFLKIYDSLDNLEKRRLWSSIIDHIEIKGYKEINIIV